MGRTLAAFSLILGLVACGGTEDTVKVLAQEEQVGQQPGPAVIPYCQQLDGYTCSQWPAGSTKNCQYGGTTKSLLQN
jgi:hypothetical protein